MTNTKQRTATRDSATEHSAAAAAALVSKLNDEFLETRVAAIVACRNDGVDRAETISFALRFYETAGRELPDFGRYSERD